MNFSLTCQRDVVIVPDGCKPQGQSLIQIVTDVNHLTLYLFYMYLEVVWKTIRIAWSSPLVRCWLLGHLKNKAHDSGKQSQMFSNLSFFHHCFPVCSFVKGQKRNIGFEAKKWRFRFLISHLFSRKLTLPFDFSFLFYKLEIII